MKLLADLHTHSKYSCLFHGKHTIEQMAITANELGLTEIAITDHGYKHLCGTDIFDLDKARDEIDEINKWSKTKVLLGIEADIIAEDGTLDIDEDTLGLIDILLIGYHRLIKTDFAGFFGGQKKTKEAVKKATNAYINAIRRYPVTIVTHLDSILKTDLYDIGKACAEKGVMVEINNRHCNWTEDQVNDLIASGCMFIVSSDAHRREDIGVVGKAFSIIKKYNIPRELVANVEFDEVEKTDDEVEIQTYYSLYEAKMKAQKEKEEKIAAKKKVEFSNSLSSEMEEKLREIAEEKGIHYNHQEEKEDDILEDYHKFRATFQETEDLIKQASNFLNQNALQEFDMQNGKVEADDEFLFDEIAEKEVASTEEPAFEQQKTETNVVDVQTKPVSEDERVLGLLQKSPKTAPEKPVEKPKTTMTKSGGAVVVKNETATKRKTTARNGQSLESFMQSMKVENETNKPEPKPAAKPENKKGRGGVFIQMNGLNDDKNNK